VVARGATSVSAYLHLPLPACLAGMSTFSTKGGLYERAQRKFGIQEGKRLFTYTFFEKQRLEALVRVRRRGLCPKTLASNGSLEKQRPLVSLGILKQKTLMVLQLLKEEVAVQKNWKVINENEWPTVQLALLKIWWEKDPKKAFQRQTSLFLKKRHLRRVMSREKSRGGEQRKGAKKNEPYYAVWKMPPGSGVCPLEASNPRPSSSRVQVPYSACQTGQTASY
jgi:hypothetical protein